MRKELGKITKAQFGRGGYQDCQIGLTLNLGGPEGWGTSTFSGFWAQERSERSQWTEEDRITALGKVVMELNKILEDAKVEHVGELVGIPVEATFDGNILKDWRVLKEVL